MRLRRKIAASAFVLTAAAGTVAGGSIVNAATHPATSTQTAEKELGGWYHTRAECEQALADMHVGPPQDWCEMGPEDDVWYLWQSG